MKRFSPILLISLLALCPGALASEPESPPIEVLESWSRPFGWGFDSCQPPSHEQAKANLEARIDPQGTMTVAELLGPIEKVTITEISPGFTADAATPEAATARVRQWLDSIIIDAAQPYRRPDTYPTWAEGVVPYINGFVIYNSRGHCYRGHFELGLSPHFVARDSQGTAWWHRWDQGFPRRVESAANEPNPSTP
ncbi:MAG: hypothetical protein AAF604_14470 [Acidobacteriota bacterium]